MLKKIFLGLSASLLLVSANATQFNAADLGDPERLISGGTPPGDDSGDRIDPNNANSAFTGVVSISIQRNGQGFICSGTLISRYHVLSAAHCVDSNGQGQVIDITQPGNSVTVVFNDDGNWSDDAAGSLRAASSVVMHPDYDGFAVCGDGTQSSLCLNDDVSIITLAQPAPEGAANVRLYNDLITAGDELTLVGYGTAGNGIDGYNVGPAFDIKRVGFNNTELFAEDDEAFPGGNGFFDSNIIDAEVWIADFDGINPDTGEVIDTLCDVVGVCNAGLGDDRETNIGGGDSGGASLVLIDGEYFLAGNNTFGLGAFEFNGNDGAFGSLFGGILLHSYLDWIRFQVVPEPGSLALLGLGLLVLARRRK